jgi:uncharacterized repeat protein (TIGR03837 family)
MNLSRVSTPTISSSESRSDTELPGSCDIFCTVVDNFGDVGVSWRLSRILAADFSVPVRLWVDDLAALARLSPDLDAHAKQQSWCGVEVRVWEEPFPEVVPAQLVIGAFACKLPQSYLNAMAGQRVTPVWINLEYLSGEDWVAGCHKLPSPHPQLPLVKYFFFPGFSGDTGGLLLERGLMTRRDTFQGDAVSQEVFWNRLGMDIPASDSLTISLFCYENSALDALFDSWAKGSMPVICVVPEGRISPQVGKYFGEPASRLGKAYSRGSLQVFMVPFVEQDQYDEMLWACDINFVRGEDSFVRAQWAARPFIWQIYPQHDAAHVKKLGDFVDKYSVQLSTEARSAVRRLWKSWNRVSDGESAGTADVAAAWSAFVESRSELDRHAGVWARQLETNNLALNLLDFYQEIGRMRAFELEGQQS